jgi:hypothetical protein
MYTLTNNSTHIRLSSSSSSIKYSSNRRKYSSNNSNINKLYIHNHRMFHQQRLVSDKHTNNSSSKMLGLGRNHPL